jgi:hypothetical protein
LAGFYLLALHRSKTLSRFWLALTLTSGFVLGLLACCSVEYSSPTVKLVGFPFVAAVFERSPTGGWVDFVGLKTYAASVANFLFGLSIPCSILAVSAWFRRRTVGFR